MKGGGWALRVGISIIFQVFYRGGHIIFFWSFEQQGYMSLPWWYGMVYSKKKGWPKQFVLNCGRDPMRKEVFAEMQRLADDDEMSLQEEIWEALLVHTRRRKL